MTTVAIVVLAALYLAATVFGFVMHHEWRQAEARAAEDYRAFKRAIADLSDAKLKLDRVGVLHGDMGRLFDAPNDNRREPEDVSPCA